MADSLRAGLARAKSFGATKNEGVHEPLAFEEEGRAAGDKEKRLTGVA